MPKTILEHAAYELAKAGLTTNEDAEARQVAINTMALVRRLEKQKNNEKQTEYVVESFYRLVQRLPLSPITDDADEWEKFEIDRKNIETNEVEKKIVWQSRRVPSIFSEDEGKTFTDHRTGKVGTSVNQAELDAKAQAADSKTDGDMPEVETPAEEISATATVVDTEETK